MRVPFNGEGSGFWPPTHPRHSCQLKSLEVSESKRQMSKSPTVWKSKSKSLKCPYNIFWLCIAGAFTKFAIFENRIFCKTRRSQVNFLLTDFVFFMVFIYIYIYIYHWIRKCAVWATHPPTRPPTHHPPTHPPSHPPTYPWATGGKRNSDETNALCGFCGLLVDSEMFHTIFCYIITGAFTKFAIFENRIFS